MKFFVAAMTSLLAAASFSQEGDALVDLTLNSDDAEIRQHLYWHEMNQSQTDALAVHFPTMSRERAYDIQRSRLEEHSRSRAHSGWKLGWTRQAEPDEVLDPIVGHYMEDRVYAQGDAVSTRYFTAGAAFAEPEIVFYLNKDLKGPVVSREEVIAAIDRVGIAMEFVNWRVTEPRTREHAIADNGIAAGVLLGERRFNLDDLDFANISGSVTVNGTEESTGKATSIMGEDPIAGLVWAANELPKWGMYLKAGDFVVSGTVCIPLLVSAGDSAEIKFTGMGALRATFIE